MWPRYQYTTNLDMNTNRDKAVSFGRDGGDVRRPVFLSMSQSRT
jgi:hypothetical protein